MIKYDIYEFAPSKIYWMPWEEGVVKGRRSSKYFRGKNKLMTDTEKPSKGFPRGCFHYYRKKSQFTSYFFRKKVRCFH